MYFSFLLYGQSSPALPLLLGVLTPATVSSWSTNHFLDFILFTSVELILLVLQRKFLSVKKIVTAYC